MRDHGEHTGSQQTQKHVPITKHQLRDICLLRSRPQFLSLALLKRGRGCSRILISFVDLCSPSQARPSHVPVPFADLVLCRRPTIRKHHRSGFPQQIPLSSQSTYQGPAFRLPVISARQRHAANIEKAGPTPSSDLEIVQPTHQCRVSSREDCILRPP